MAPKLVLKQVAKAKQLHLRSVEDGANLAGLTLPPGWRKFRNPEGFLYFQDPRRRVVTGTNIMDPNLERLVEASIKLIDEGMRGMPQPAGVLPIGSEIYLEIEGNGDQHIACYYIVCHGAQRIVWLEDRAPRELPVIQNEVQYKLLFGYLYFRHGMNFPNHLHVDQGLVANLTATLSAISHAPEFLENYSARDLPFTREVSSEILRMLKSLFRELTSRASYAQENREIASTAKSICDHYYRKSLGVGTGQPGVVPLLVLNVLGCRREPGAPSFTLIPH